MAHYVVTSSYGTETVSAWSEDDARREYIYDRDPRREGNGSDAADWDKWAELTEESISIRPATVREAMAAEYGDDWAKGTSHVATFFEGNYRTDYKDLLIITHTEANNRQGYDEAVAVSNYRVLRDRWSELEGLTDGPWSNCDVIALELDLPAPEDLTDVIDGLADYPVVDEQAWSEVEQEFIQEHWDSYGKSAVLDAVAKAIDQDGRSDLTTAAEDIITQLVWDGILDYGCGGRYPTMIDVSACDFGEKEIAAWFSENYETVVTVSAESGSRQPFSFDLTKANLVYLTNA